MPASRPLAVFVATLAFACSPTDSNPGGAAGQGATAGAAGAAAQGGTAGTSGKGGAAAAGGTAGLGGSAGQGGIAGKGGAAGKGGSAGQAGAAGMAGQSGSAGQGGKSGGPSFAASPAHVGPNGETQATFDGAPPDAGAWIGLFAAAAPDTAPLAQQGTSGSAKGSLPFATPPDVGAYELRLFGDATSTKKLATAPFTVELPYDLDPAFAGGKVTFDFLGKKSADWVCGIRGIAGGKVIAAVTAKTGDKDASGWEKNAFGVMRFSANGALDPTFGNGGRATITPTTHALSGCAAFALQPDGKILVGGFGYNTTATGDFVLARFTADGAPDAGFGSAGIVTTDFGQWEELGSLAVMPDGRIVAGGTLEYNQPGVFTSAAFARYASNGTLDATFGTAGTMTLPKKSWQETARALVVAADGSFHAGISDNKSTQTGTVSIVHVGATGMLDAGFGTAGVVVDTAPVGPIDRSLVALVPTPVSNALVVLGQMQTSWFLGRYSPSSGAVDTAFAGGHVTATFGSAGARAAAVAFTPSAELLVGISPDAFDAVGGADGNFGLARHKPTGELDLAFGRLRYKWSTGTPVIGSRVTAMDLQADGSVLLGGLTDRGDGSFDFDVAVMRLVKTAGW